MCFKIHSMHYWDSKKHDKLLYHIFFWVSQCKRKEYVEILFVYTKESSLKVFLTFKVIKYRFEDWFAYSIIQNVHKGSDFKNR